MQHIFLIVIDGYGKSLETEVQPRMNRDLHGSSESNQWCQPNRVELGIFSCIPAFLIQFLGFFDFWYFGSVCRGGRGRGRVILIVIYPRFFLASLFAASSILSKETGLATLPLIGLYDFFYHFIPNVREGREESRRDEWKRRVHLNGESGGFHQIYISSFFSHT